jgi:hypothetical protein
VDDFMSIDRDTPQVNPELTHMKRTYVALVSLVLISFFWSSLGPGGGRAEGQGRQSQPTLPGARPAIDAAKYPSLQAALDALPPSGGVVRLPAGTFEIREPLLLTQEDVLVQGSGSATHIKNATEDGRPALIVRPAKFPEDHEAMQWRVKLADFRLTGNPKSGHGIEATNVNELFIDGVTVSEHGGDGIRMLNCYEDPRICDALITYNKQAGLHLIACHDIVVASNQFEENADAVRCIDGFNLCMTGNCLDDHLRDGVVIENTYGSVVSGNMIEECAGTAIVLDRDCYGITLSANVIAHEQRGGIDLLDAHGCTVSANTFTIVQENALVIGPQSGRITVTGNNFSDSTIGSGQENREQGDRAASGLSLTGTSDVVISGNLFAGVEPKAIGVEGAPSRRVLVSGNVLTDVESDHARLVDSVSGENLERGGPP